MNTRFYFPRLHVATAMLMALGSNLVLFQAVAHEFWLAPSTHTPQQGEQVEIYAMIGHGSEAESFPRNHQHIKRFCVVDDLGTRKADGINHELPTARVRIRNAGSHIVAYESHPQESVLPAKRFARYLKEEGLEHILPLLEGNQHSDPEIREQYTRCAKTLLWSRGEAGAFRDQWTGLPLEIKCISNPFQMKGHEALVFQIKFNGEPLSGIQIKAIRPGSQKASQTVRSNEEGIATIQCGEKGRWLFSGIHMIPVEHHDDKSWKSYWASLTVHIGSQGSGHTDLAKREMKP